MSRAQKILERMSKSDLAYSQAVIDRADKLADRPMTTDMEKVERGFARALDILNGLREDDNVPLLPPNRMYRGSGEAVMDQAELDVEHQLQGSSHGYSHNKNSIAGPGVHHGDGKRGAGNSNPNGKSS